MFENVVSLDERRLQAQPKQQDFTPKSQSSLELTVMKWVPVDYDQLVRQGSTGQFVTAERLYGFGEFDQMSRFFKVSGDLISALSECDNHIQQGAFLAADDVLMNCRPVIQEMFMLRDISEAVGLVSLRCLHAANVDAITNTPDIASTMMRAITRLRAAPFMKFDIAIELADDIDTAAGTQEVLPGYNELVQLLLDDNVLND